MSTNSPAAVMTLSRRSKAWRRSSENDKPSVEIFEAVSAVNVAIFAVIGGKLKLRKDVFGVSDFYSRLSEGKYRMRRWVRQRD